MRFTAFTRPRGRITIARRLVGVFVLLAVTVSCAPGTPEPIDTAHILGHWQLVTNSETESFDISSGGDFNATIHGNDFLATTLSQSEPVKLSGRWILTGNTLTFHIEKSSEELLIGQSHRYEVESLTSSRMSTIDATGRHQTLNKAL